MRNKGIGVRCLWILAGVLAAFLFMSASVLVACRFRDPVLFDKITAPAVRTARSVKHTIETEAEKLQAHWAAGGEGTGEFLSDGSEDKVPLSALPDTENGGGEQNPAPESLSEEKPAEETVWQKLDPADESVTKLITRGEQSVLTGGTADLVYFNQGEAPWADALYGEDPIGTYGCGPTAMAIVVSSLTDQLVDPAGMAQWAAEHGYWASHSGSRLSLIPDAAAEYGLQTQSFREFTPEALERELIGGKMFVALMTKGHFTESGHFIILRGVTLSGEILVADPNSTERSLAVWDAQLLLDELSAKTDAGAPLWLIDRAE